MKDTRQHLRDVCLTWERWRIAYNLMLLVEYHMIPHHVRELVADQISGPYWVLYVLCVVVANGFYSLGPFFELYAQVFLRWRLGRGRYALLAVGFLFSIFWMGVR